MMAKKTYRIPVSWEVYGHYEVEAESLQDAIDQTGEMCLPSGEYVMDSDRIDADILADDYPGESFDIP